MAAHLQRISAEYEQVSPPEVEIAEYWVTIQAIYSLELPPGDGIGDSSGEARRG